VTTTDATGPSGPVRVPIDPRIRERRIAVRRNEGRRRLRLLVIGGSVVAIGLLGWLATRSPLLDVDTIRVVGSRHTTAAAVTRATGVHHGDAMLDIDDGAVAARVRALPWVDTATVRREWPGTVTVEVTERRAVAAARGPSRSATQETWLLVDADGRLLARQSHAQEGLPAIEGGPFGDTPGATIDAAGKGALAVARAIGPDRVPQIPVVAVVDGDQLELRLAGDKPGVSGGVVRFGPPDQIREKLLAVFTVLDHVDLRDLAVLDVRVPSAPVITRG
jgi:cell division protein FtsQ